MNGVDPYAIMLAEAKRRWREALLTFRMNDDHGTQHLDVLLECTVEDKAVSVCCPGRLVDRVVDIDHGPLSGVHAQCIAKRSQAVRCRGVRSADCGRMVGILLRPTAASQRMTCAEKSL